MFRVEYAVEEWGFEVETDADADLEAKDLE